MTAEISAPAIAPSTTSAPGSEFKTAITADASRTTLVTLNLRAAVGAPETLGWSEWSVGAPTSFAYSLSTSAFGDELGAGTVAQNPSNSILLFTNSFGYSVYDVTANISSRVMTAGNTYWLTISNATDAASDGTQGWDIPNVGLGGPATCNFRQSGTNFGDCGLGGESFTLSFGETSTSGMTPEPSSIMLLGSGILGLAGVLRRKLNT